MPEPKPDTATISKILQAIEGAVTLPTRKGASIMFGNPPGSADPSPGALDLAPGVKSAALTAPAVAKLLMHIIGGNSWLTRMLQNPSVAAQANKAWRDIGFSAKEVEPSWLGAGIEAVAMKAQPYPRGGEALKLWRHPLQEKSTTSSISVKDAIERTPSDILLKHRLAGNLTNPDTGEQMGWATQPIAEFNQSKWFDARQALARYADRYGFELPDSHGGNIGFFRGRPIVVDEGSVRPMGKMPKRLTAKIDAAVDTSEAIRILLEDPEFLKNMDRMFVR